VRMTASLWIHLARCVELVPAVCVVHECSIKFNVGAGCISVHKRVDSTCGSYHFARYDTKL